MCFLFLCVNELKNVSVGDADHFSCQYRDKMTTIQGTSINIRAVYTIDVKNTRAHARYTKPCCVRLAETSKNP